MASGFFALFDDIAALMDDVVVMSKITTKKTAGILGDDLAVNAEKATGFVSSREIPVLWAITKGSFLNKLIILPIAFLLSSFLPWAVTLILVLGAIYLAFEGVEKVVEYVIPHEHVVEEINIEANTFKLKGPDGVINEYVARNPENLKRAVVGDLVVITITEAVAIVVEHQTAE